MIDACALYFPTAKLSLKSVFPHGRSDEGLLRSATWFEYESGDGVVRLNLRHKDLEKHLQGFRAYVARLPDSGASRAEAKRLISRTKLTAGVVLPHPVAPDSLVFASLVRLIERFDGFMFVADSIMLPDGTFLVGPMAESEVSPGEPDLPAVREVDPDHYRHERPVDGADPERIAMREHHYRTLASRGFECARWLPLYRSEDHQDTLRPLEEISARLFALNALFLWVAASEETASSARLQSFVDRNNLRDHLTSDELEILASPRPEAHRDHSDTIGWRLENMWALAWILGFDPAPPFYVGQLPQEITDSTLFEFLPDLDGSLSEFTASVQPRTAGEVARQEDLFYCTHNAVRSAQMGEDTVPRDFHPVGDGGAIHERRHSLTWAMSPGTAWDDTDLST